MRHLRKAVIASLVAVALLLPVAPTSAGDSYGGKWKGKTEDDDKLVFKVNRKDELTRFRADYTVFAGDLCHGVDLKINLKDKQIPIKDGAFKFKYKKNVEEKEFFAKISGTFDSSEKAAGKLKSAFRVVSYGVIYCSSFETFEWKAHKV